MRSRVQLVCLASALVIASLYGLWRRPSEWENARYKTRCFDCEAQAPGMGDAVKCFDCRRPSTRTVGPPLYTY